MAKITDFNCYKCGKGPENGTTTYRVNELGVLGKFACEKCLDPNKHPAPEPEVLELSKALEKGRPEAPNAKE